MIWHLFLKPIWNWLYGDRRAQRIEDDLSEANYHASSASDQAEMRRQLVERWHRGERHHGSR